MTTILDNRYEIIGPIGGGTFGQTYKARDLKRPKQPFCAIKALKPDASVSLAIAKELFDKEAAMLDTLTHDQIPRLYTYFPDKDIENPAKRCFYLAQNFVDGHTLDREINPNQRLDEQTVIGLLVDILEVLDYVHGHNVIHRDLKPANIMRRKDGKIVLIDFGAVKQIKGLTVNNGQTESTIVIGTKGYMPSEQSIGKPKLSSDVYAVGMIGIQALTGKYPHSLPDDNNGEVMWRNLASQVSPKFAQILHKMVKHDYRQRYENAGLALQALLPLDQRPKVRQTSGTNRINTVISRRPVPPLWKRREVIFAGLGLTGLGLVFLVNEINKQPSSTKQTPPEEPISTPDPQPVDPQPIIQTPPPANTFQFTTVRLNAVGQIVERKNLSAELLTEDLGNGIVLEMVKIPGGTFIMGSPDSELEKMDREGPQHQVTVPDFYMGKYVVTQAQYQAIMGNNPANFKGDKRPVEQVSWNEAVAFCQKLSSRTGKKYRLPSEAEWEYACRGGTTTPFHFGETITPDFVNYDGNYPYAQAPKGQYRQQTTEVGSFPPNAFGLYDMHGNVWEWCEDIWHDNYNGAPTDGTSWLKNQQNNEKIYRLLRGGSWFNDAVYCRSAYRNNFSPELRGNLIGFRLVV